MTQGPAIVVWIVDDAPSVRKSLTAVLESADLAVRDYESAGHFLASFDPAEPGCLVVDQHMPDMTGLELVEHLRARGTLPPTILITGQGDVAMANRAKVAGAKALCNKPVDGEDLIALIASLMFNDA